MHGWRYPADQREAANLKGRECVNRRTYTVAKYLLLSVVSVSLYITAAKYALAERGYFAVGGEAFLLLLPVFYYLISTMIHDAVAEYRKSKGGAVSDIGLKK